MEIQWENVDYGTSNKYAKWYLSFNSVVLVGFFIIDLTYQHVGKL